MRSFSPTLRKCLESECRSPPACTDDSRYLATFTFNADWRIKPTGAVSKITKCHWHISTICFHGLSYAFVIQLEHPRGAASSENWSPLLTHIRRRHNDPNIMLAAFNEVHFPKLQRIRALSQSMLNALNKSDGPCGMFDVIDGRRLV